MLQPVLKNKLIRTRTMPSASSFAPGIRLFIALLFCLPLVGLSATVADEITTTESSLCPGSLFDGRTQIPNNAPRPPKSPIRRAWKSIGDHTKYGVQLNISNLDSTKLTREQRRERLAYMLRHTGYAPTTIQSRDLIEKRNAVLAFPINVGGSMAWRLVAEYEYVPGIITAPRDAPSIPKQNSRLVLRKLWLASGAGDDIGTVDLDGSINEGRPDLLFVRPVSDRAGNFSSIWDVMNTWFKNFLDEKNENNEAAAKAKDKEQDKKKKDKNQGATLQVEAVEPPTVDEAEVLLAQVRAIEDRHQLDPISKLVDQLRVIANAIGDRDPTLKEDILETIETIYKLDLYKEIEGPILVEYQTFMQAYFWTSNRMEIARDIEGLQDIQRPEDIKRVRRKAFWGNGFRGMWERGRRWIQSGPTKLATAALSAVSVVGITYLTVWMMSPQTEGMPVTPAASDGTERQILALPFNAPWKPIITLPFDGQSLEFANDFDGDESDANNRLVPLNQESSLWRQLDQKITLKISSGENVTYEIIHESNEHGAFVYLSPVFVRPAPTAAASTP